ncbi:MAG TPA: hypothetical protein VLE99_06315 [Candidatus Saccharimonadales bacterium]|nr:hypothetical protein [Candidatus Saccharimonadales bacterium]
MATNKHFLQDRTALLLVSGTAFLTLASVALILLKLGSEQGTTIFIASYRSSLGIGSYINGTARDILSFAVAAVLIFTVSLVLAYRSYAVRRELSLVVLVLTIPLLLFLIVVSNALLVLR